MNGPIVIALYKPKDGKDAATRKLARGHQAMLKDLDLVGPMPATLIAADDGTILEVFQWKDQAAVEASHKSDVVQAYWQAMADVCDFGVLSDLAEAQKTFPHFQLLAFDP